MFKNLKWRLIGIVFAITAIILFGIGLFLMNAMDRFALKQTEIRLTSYAGLIAGHLQESLSPNPDLQLLQSYVRQAAKETNANVTILDPQGKLLADSAARGSRLVDNGERPEVLTAMAGEIGKSVRDSLVLGENMYYLALPVKTGGKVAGIVRVAVPWHEITAGQRHFQWGIGIASIIVLILALMAVSFFTTTMVVPLQEMTKAARRMGEGKLDANLSVFSDDEMGDLGRALNNTAQRLRDTFSQITEERNKIKAILTSMTDGVIAVDRVGNILLINPAIERTFNINSEESIGKSVIKTVRNFELDRLLHSALQSGEPIIRELQILAPEPQTFRISTAPLTNESELVGVVAVMRDITTVREVERMKADFVANVSHELRTPMTSIKGFVETLLDGALDDTQTARHFLDIINEETDRLSRLISDLLSLSRIEAKQRDHHKVPVDFVKIIYNTISILAPQAAEKMIGIEIELQPDLPVIVADEDMMGQLLINLIDNAVKYTPEGGLIKISARKSGSGIKVRVADSGIGIPKDSIPRLFERFYRVDKARSREMGGTGLGLAIVKHILEVHEGTITVNSVLGKGSKFTFYLPGHN